MGGAFIAIADDENAMYNNVAGLSQIDRSLTQVSVQVNERENFHRDSATFVSKFFTSTDKERVTLEEYLESDYTFKSEVQEVANYTWGVSFLSEKRSLELNRLSGFNSATDDKKRTYQLAFSTRFPVLEKLTRRPELYAGIRGRYSDINREIPALMVKAGQDVYDLDFHLFYRANSRLNVGFAANSLISGSTDDVVGARDFSASYDLGFSYTYGERRDTIIAADFTNMFNASRSKDPRIRLGVERQFLDNDFAVRIGANDGLLTLGFGLRFWEDFRLDYAFVNGRVLDEHQVSARFNF